MTLRPCSDSERGLFISVDGPSGAGKSTIVRHLAQMLVAAGEDVHVTAEPSNGPIGKLCFFPAGEGVMTVTGVRLGRQRNGMSLPPLVRWVRKFSWSARLKTSR